MASVFTYTQARNKQQTNINIEFGGKQYLRSQSPLSCISKVTQHRNRGAIVRAVAWRGGCCIIVKYDHARSTNPPHPPSWPPPPHQISDWAEVGFFVLFNIFVLFPSFPPLQSFQLNISIFNNETYFIHFLSGNKIGEQEVMLCLSNYFPSLKSIKSIWKFSRVVILGKSFCFIAVIVKYKITQYSRVTLVELNNLGGCPR